MTRFDACALNRIAQLMASDGGIAPAQQYKGKVPTNVDALVKEAVTPPGALA